MRLEKWLGWAVIAIIVMGGLPGWIFAAPIAQETGPNLLANGDFEQAAVMQGNVGEIQVAAGWHAWHLATPPCIPWKPPCYIPLPINCQGHKDYGCFWARPEFGTALKKQYANRVHSGERAQKYFSFSRMHQAGLWQQVHNVPIGAALRFSIYMEAWMCTDSRIETDKCSYGRVSDQPGEMHLRVGIDPTGGTDPFSPNVVWSGEMPAWDRWVRLQVEAEAQSSTVTVFTHSRAEWEWARENNDVYLDDAELVTVGAVTNPPVQAAAPNQPTPKPQSQPQTQVKPVTRADGAQVHTIVAGDTLLGIALAYGVTVDDLVQLNNLDPAQFLRIGQELIVKAPPGYAPPQLSTGATPAAQPALVQSTPASSVAASPAGLCVIAFDDQNMNTLYDNNEELAADVQFNVLDGETVVQSHTTDGSNEPYCFSDIKPGMYVVSAQPPGGCKSTSTEKAGVSAAAGQTVQVAFGCVNTEKPAASKGDNSTRSITDANSLDSNPVMRVAGILVSIGGIIVLVIAGVIGTAMISRRR